MLVVAVVEALTVKACVVTPLDVEVGCTTASAVVEATAWIVDAAVALSVVVVEVANWVVAALVVEAAD